MRTHLMAIAALVGGTLTLNAQNPQTPQTPQQQPRPTETRPTGDTTQRAGQTASAQTVTVTGCLKAEKDVAGRRPNVAERAGVGEDYILTNVKMSQGSTTSGIGLATMYEIEGIAEAELQKHINHQVEITGTLPNAMGNRGAAGTGMTGTATTGGTGTGATGTAGTTGTGATGTTGTGTTGTASRQGNQAGSNADLPELNGTSLKMVSATCPAAQ